MTRKTISGLAAAMMLSTTILLAACSSNDKEEQASQPPASTQASGESPSASGGAPAETPAADPLGKYEEPITVTQVMGFNPPQDSKTPKGLTPEKNAYVSKLKEMLNIDLKYLWTVPSEQFDQKFALAVSSGDLPDVMSLKLLDFESFRQQDQLADLTEAYEKYASPTLKKYLESDGGRTLKMFTYDGKLLGLPSYEDPFMSSQILWIRQDWLDKLQLQPPTTLEELEQVAEAFVKNDPDGNNKNDTYGISMNKELISWGFDARGLFYTMGAYPKAWTKGSDGKLIPGEIQPETKAALEKMNDWYKKGILDKEFAFKDINKAVEDVVAGKVGITFGEWWDPEWPLNLSKEKDPKAEWKPFPLPSYNGNPGLTLVPGLRLNWVVTANKKMEHPEAVVKMANFYHEMWLPKYQEENKPENGYVYNWYEPRIYNPLNIDDLYTRVNAALKANQDTIDAENPEAPQLFANAKKFLSGDPDTTAWGFYNSRVKEDGGWGLTRKIKEEKKFVYNEFYGTPTPTQVERGSSLDKLTDETYLKIIMGSGKTDEFDKYADSWKKLGGDEIAEEVNAWYAERQ
ncbi:extracellular solute-binding protein [Cohnella herbarum]|uniref:Extracellular solute-binding protein n=1 Tax=Cohnella herbarum TaxID=2728023 RepID=A0A7Z2VNV0_9BACL|nr:extracellular solute-binding protein [Cohnella herbarum]QJD86402.1 extracellular solute-binding protein [Cohnella herbarum]